MIEVKQLRKAYGDHEALKGVDFSIQQGKIYGLLGANGAGKSTTMNIMTGYLGASSGEVIVNGTDILLEPEKVKKQIGYLPEQPPLYLDMKVTEYLDFVSEIKGVNKIDRPDHVAGLMKKVQLTSVSGRLIKNLSKGYRQRVGLAAALATWPEIIILDEPTVGLDPEQIIEIRQLIKNLSDRHTIILSSHILAEVQEICDQIIVIQGGKVVANERTEDLIKLMSQSNIYRLTAKGSAQGVTDVISAIPDITIEELTEVDAEEAILLLRVETDEDPRETIFNNFAQRSIPILEMQKQTSNLEQAFLELIKEKDTEVLDSVSSL